MIFRREVLATPNSSQRGVEIPSEALAIFELLKLIILAPHYSARDAEPWQRLGDVQSISGVKLLNLPDQSSGASGYQVGRGMNLIGRYGLFTIAVATIKQAHQQELE